MSAPFPPPGSPYGHRRPLPVAVPVPGVVVLGRVAAFTTLALTLLWAVVLAVVLVGVFGVAMLTVMWGPACDTPTCGVPLGPVLGVAVTGCAVTLLIVAIALPVAWRRPGLLGWALVALTIGVGTAVWSVSAVPWSALPL